MADSRTIQINLKAVSDFNDVVNNAKQIQNALNKLKIPENLRTNFTKIFGDIEKYSEKAAQSMANGFKTKGDVSSFEKSVNGVNTSFEKLLLTISKIDKEGLGFGSYEGQIKQLEVEIQGLNKQLGEMASKYSKAVNEVTKPANSKSSAWEDFKQAFDVRDVEGMEKALKRLEQARSRATEKNKGAYDGLEVFRNALAAVKGEGPEAAKIIEEINKKLAQQNEFKIKGLQETTGSLEEASTATRDLSEQQSRLGKSSVESAQGMQQVNSELDHFKSRIAYFFGAQNAVNLFKRALRSAFETVKDLDKVMTETAVVTKFDVSDMWKQLPEYTKRANELGVTIHSAYEAATIYYQQGLETNQVMEVSNQTLKMARIAGLDAAEATDRMTNALRGFNMEINEMNAERVADVYSKLAAMSASNVDEISTAMTKVASLASNANMEFETTAAFLAQIIETTRESAETAGTALKTVIARFSEVKKLYSEGELLGTDEEGEAIDVNKVSKALRTAGVNLNEYLTGAKGLDDIFIELASKWNNLDQIQQRYIATMAAGSRQQSRFIAMMQDYARTQELVGAAETASGASQEQYEKTLESLETKLNRLKNAWNEFVMGIANNQLIKGAVDLLTGFINAVNKLTSSLPGALNGVTKLALAFGAFKIGKNVFNQGLAKAGQIFMKGTTDIAEKSSMNFVRTFKSGLQTRISNVKGLFKPIETEVENVNNKISTLSDQGRIERMYGYDPSNSNTRLAGMYGGDYGKYAQQFSQVGESAEKAKTQMLDLQSGLSGVSTAMMGVGSAIMILTQLLKIMGVNDEKVTKTLMAVGLALTFVGSILPILGKAFDALGLEIAKDGQVAQAGWGWIGLIIAAVVALVTVTITLVSSAETAAERVERLADSAKEAANAADEAVQKYEDLKSALDDLKDRENVLDGLIVGTQAWKDAVLQVNKQVLELLQNYPKLAAFVTSNNGVLGIDYDAAAEVLDQYNQIAVEAQKASVYSNAIATQAKTDLTKENLFTNNNVFAQNRLGEVDETVDLLAKALAGDAKSIEELDFNPEKFKEGSDAFNDYIFTLASSKDVFVNATDEGIGALRSYGQELLATEAEMSTLLPALVDSRVANEEYADGVKNFLSSGFLNDQLAERSNRKYSALSRDEKDAYKEYFKNLYGTNFKKVKGNGDIQLANDKTLKREDAMNRFIGAKAGEIVDPIVSEFVNKISSSKDEVAKVIESFYEKGGGAGLTLNDLNTLTDATTWSFNGSVNVDEILTSLGFDRNSDIYKQLFADLTEGIRLSQEAVEQLDSTAEKLQITTNGLGQFSGAALLDFFNQIREIENESGVAAGQTIKEQIDNVIANMDSDEIAKFGEALRMIDWNDIDSVESLPSILEDLEVSTEDIEDPLSILIENIIKLGHASRQTNGEIAASTIKSAGKVLSEIKSGNAGRTFSKEDYKAIESVLSEEQKNNFVTDADGNYIYLGNTMSELQAAIEQNTSALLEDTRAQLEGKIAGADQFETALKVRGLTTEDVSELNVADAYGLLSGFISSNKDKLDTFGIEKLGNDTKIEKLSSEDINAILAALAQNLEDRSSNQAQLESVNKSLGFSGLSADQVSAQGGTNSDVRLATMTEASSYGLDPDEVLATSDALQQQYETLKQYPDIADRIALDNARMNAGVKDLIDNYADWAKEIAAGPGNPNYASTFNNLKKAINNILGVSEDLDDSFYSNAKNMALMERAANDDMSAIVELQKAAAKEIVFGVDFDESALTEEQQVLNDIINNFQPDDIVVGATLDDVGLTDALNELIRNGVITANAVNDALETIGWEPQIEYEDVVVDGDSVQRIKSEGGYYLPDGKFVPVSTEQEVESLMGNTVKLPIINGKKSSFQGAPSATVSPSSRKGGSGGGGGGGGKEEKPTYWENPYDELYNLNEKINEALRERERLERRYQKIAALSTTTAGEMRQAFSDQINQLEREIELQKQLLTGYQRKLENAGQQLYTDKDGNRISFEQLGVTKYGSVDMNTGVMQIDYEGLEAIENDPNRSEEGEAAEAYLSMLEEIAKGIQSTRDNIWDRQDEIEDISQQAIDDYLTFEERVYDALIEQREKEIDAFRTLSDAINDATNRVINKMQEQIEEERQARENDKTEQEIADKEARLAYLSRDTSGANSLEIMKLQEELDDARQSYTDSLIDQAIQELQKDADKASEQREKQIELLEEQLRRDQENGNIRTIAEDLINDGGATALENSELVSLLQGTEGYANMSEIGKSDWTSKFVEAWNKAQSGKEGTKELEKQQKESAESVGGPSTGSGSGSGSGSGTPKKIAPAPVKKYPLPLSDQTAKDIATTIAYGYNYGGWGVWPEREQRINEKFGPGAYWKIQELVDAICLWGAWYSNNKNATYASFKTGGLANFTGPAWLDGTRSHPEMVLNAADTENLIALKDILGSLLKRSSNAMAGAASEFNFDIDINADISDDYDVEQLADKVKGIIYDEAMYKNVSTINRLR